MNTRHLIAVAAALTSLTLSPTVFAQTARIASETNQEIKKADATVQSLCGKLKKILSPAEWAEFNKAQQAWVAFRERERNFYENNIVRMNASQNFPLFVVQSVTEARVKQLEELLDAWNH